ncbi:MAG TPA: WYL domain-containing protein [Spirochaetota bacterium]|nr:WYL domain-containing protein [Spirochaetota bacterium]
MSTSSFPNPRTELGVIKRYLHVLALLQNSNDNRRWNATTLADLLTKDEPDAVLNDKNIRDYISKYLENELSIDVDRTKGGRVTNLAEDLDEALHEKVALLYSNFVTRDSSREIILRSFLKKHPRDGLWMLARIYFAALEKKRITFDYTTNTGYEIKEAKYHPYHIVFRNNNLYLLGKVKGKTDTWLLILNRIRNLQVTDETFDEDIPDIDIVFNDCLGSFIGKKYDVKLRFKKNIINQLEQFLSILEPQFTDIDEETGEVSFAVSDDFYLCKQLFMYGNAVEIISPPELRSRMITMLQESMSTYET